MPGQPGNRGNRVMTPKRLAHMRRICHLGGKAGGSEAHAIGGRAAFKKAVDQYGYSVALEALAAKRRRDPTTPEREVMQVLDALGVAWEHEKLLPQVSPFFYYDLYLPEHRAVIEIDGEYWHGDAATGRPAPDQDQPERDARKTESLVAAGYRVLRIAESFVEAGTVGEIVQAFIQSSQAVVVPGANQVTTTTSIGHSENL